MVEITRLVQQEKICERKEKDWRGNAVQESRRYTSSSQTEDDEVNVHPLPRPGLHPTETVVSKIDGRVNEVTPDPAVREVAINLPHEDAAEDDAKENEERDIDRLEKRHTHPLP